MALYLMFLHRQSEADLSVHYFLGDPSLSLPICQLEILFNSKKYALLTDLCKSEYRNSDWPGPWWSADTTPLASAGYFGS